MARKLSSRKNTVVTAIAFLALYAFLSLLLESYVLDTDSTLAILLNQNVIVAVRGNKGAAHRDSSWGQHHASSDERKQGLGACLDLTTSNQDDRNNRTAYQSLSGWLAYHYTVLPLRSLIVAINDTRSTTNLTAILGQWKRDTHLDVLVWEDQDFLGGRQILRRRKQMLNVLGNSSFEVVMEGLRKERRDAFISQCLLQHSVENTKWVVASLDVADVVIPSKRTLEETLSLLDDDADLEPAAQLGRKSKSCRVYPTVHVFPTLHQSRPMDEIQLEDGLGLKTRNSSFEFVSTDSARSVAGDNNAFWMVVDVSMTRAEEVAADETAATYQHLLPYSCDSAALDEPFVNSTIRAVKRRRLPDHSEGLRDEILRPHGVGLEAWHDEFFGQVGVPTAERLLGPQPRSSSTNKEPEESERQPCALLFFGLARKFADLAYPSIKRHLIDANPTCDVYVHTYNVTKARGGSRGKLVQSEDGHGVVHPEEVLLLLGEHADRSNIVFETELDFRAQRDFKSYRRHFPNPSAWDYPHSMDNMIRQWHSIEKVWKLMESHERALRHRYRRVGLFRLDMVYTHPISIIPEASNGDKELAVIPSIMYLQTTWFGYNDRMFYGTRTYAEVWATDRFGSVNGYLHWQKHHTNTKKLKGLHSEDFMRFLLTQKWSIPLTIKDFCFHRVRSNGLVLTEDCLYLQYGQMLLMEPDLE